MTYSEIYALRIRELCKKRKITINKLATLAGLKQSTMIIFFAVPAKILKYAPYIKLQMYLE